MSYILDLHIHSRYSRASLQQIIPSAQTAALEEFEQKLHLTDFNELFESEPSKLFAEAIGLMHYEWLAYDYVARDFHDLPDEFRHVTKIM